MSAVVKVPDAAVIVFGGVPPVVHDTGVTVLLAGASLAHVPLKRDEPVADPSFDAMV
jgi:hypothetical protein